MKKIIICLAGSLLLSGTIATAQKNVQPFIITGKIELQTPYAKAEPFLKGYYDSLYYEKARTNKRFECLKVFYQSDTAVVEAWLYKPVNTENKKLPLVIFNRGGMGNFGNLDESFLVSFYKIAEAGYAVLATKTRFAGATGKNDEHGGIDVNDVVNLQIIYKNLQYIDTNNIFMYGYSRGGQMTYQASKRMKLNAMATAAGTTDWYYMLNKRREFVEGWADAGSPETDYPGFKKVFKNWNTDSTRILNERSAVKWADSINTPVLMMHSRQDTKVECTHSLRLAEKLQLYNKVYALIIYNEPSHSLPFKYFDSYGQMFIWFNKFKKP